MNLQSFWAPLRSCSALSTCVPPCAAGPARFHGCQATKSLAVAARVLPPTSVAHSRAPPSDRLRGTRCGQVGVAGGVPCSLSSCSGSSLVRHLCIGNLLGDQWERIADYLPNKMD